MNVDEILRLIAANKKEFNRLMLKESFSFKNMFRSGQVPIAELSIIYAVANKIVDIKKLIEVANLFKEDEKSSSPFSLHRYGLAAILDANGISFEKAIPKIKNEYNITVSERNLKKRAKARSQYNTVSQLDQIAIAITNNLATNVEIRDLDKLEKESVISYWKELKREKFPSNESTEHLANILAYQSQNNFDNVMFERLVDLRNKFINLGLSRKMITGAPLADLNEIEPSNHDIEEIAKLTKGLKKVKFSFQWAAQIFIDLTRIDKMAALVHSGEV